MPIGALARLSRLSVKALRLYDAEGLLPPARVDPATGYRYYRRDQVRTATSIALLRSLDVPLATIREMLAADDQDRLRELLAAERERAARELARRRRALDSLERLMTAGDLMPYEVGLGGGAAADHGRPDPAGRSRADRPRRRRDGGGAGAPRLARRLGRRRPLVRPLSDRPRRPPSSSRSGCPSADAAPAAQAEVLRVAGGPVVTTLHVGSYDELPLAYDALLSWAHERGHELAGPIRETYLSPRPRAAPKLVTRISIPVAREAP